MASVQLQNISKSFKDVVAVKDVNLTIKDGEFFSLLGPSGCGKTTILRMMAGFYVPTIGKILFDNKDVSILPPNKRNTAMVFQNYALFPHMTVFENVAFGLRARKIQNPDRQSRVRKALELVNLAELENRHVTQLSGGQQQRVALARAIVIEPKILLLDEPLSNLDAKLRRETREQIQKLQRKLKITTIYVTHDQEEALTLSDRIALMNDGVCQQIGTPFEIYNHPANAFVAKFIGRSNLLNGTVINVKSDDMLVELKQGIQLIVKTDDKLLTGQKVVLAIKPESVILHKNDITGMNILKGRIITKHFNGYLIEYEIDVDGIVINNVALNEENVYEEINIYVEIPKDKINVL
ncbi:MAG: iron(III) transport system ATP-binding protein [Candidatus Poribacteria bacterium]|nr:iron(III) transport system ATP-binding protein [Candidatus Poribacteria bacterium]